MTEHEYDSYIRKALWSAVMEAGGPATRPAILNRAIKICVYELARTHGLKASHRTVDIALNDALGAHGDAA